MPESPVTAIRQIIQEQGPLTSRQIQAALEQQFRIKLDKETINSILYGQLHELLIRDKDENGFPTWRMKQYSFEAARGLEVQFYNELMKQKIITPQTAQLDYAIKNRRNNKTYHLDIAIFQNDKKYNIEIDGYEHIRADARESIQNQLEQNPKKQEIEIDWMDNNNSFVDFKQIDNKKVFHWCTTHPDWCIRYHEELLKPHDITRNIWLIESGWKIIRFWNFEIKNDRKRCINESKSFLQTEPPLQ